MGVSGSCMGDLWALPNCTATFRIAVWLCENYSRTMDWDRIRIFLAVARARQILGAAQQLRLNHATVGRQLTALEAELGTKLVERQTNGCSLTPAGEALLASAERVESELLQAGSKLSGATAAISGTVRVGAPDGL